MSSQASITTPAPEMLTTGRQAALINLLTDDDPAIYRTIRKKIVSCGPDAVHWLRPHILSSDPVLRRRAQEIIQYFDRQTADTRFLTFCLKQGEDLNLEHGAWLLAQTQYPEVNLEAYQALFDSYAGELLERVDLQAEPDQILAAINEYIFGELRFTGNEQNYQDPENSYLNRVVDRRLGNPINLCLVYLLLTRRLNLPIAGIGLPGHFICRYQTSSKELYIDVFNGGKVWTKANCIQYLLYGNYSLQEDYLVPTTPRRMLMRICGNLHQIYHHLEMTEEATRLQRYLIALAR